MLQEITLLTMFIFVLSDRLDDLTHLFHSKFTSFQVLSNKLGYSFIMKNYTLF